MTGSLQDAVHEAGDAALVAATRAGDDRAFAELYTRHLPAVRVAVGERTRDREHAHDVAQEAFTRALARLDELREPDRFRPWLLSIARRLAVDGHRAAARLRTEPLEGDRDDPRDDLPDGRLADAAAGPEETADLRELAALVRGCVAGLSERDATAVAMVTWLGLGPQDLAGAFGISHTAAKVMLHRARHRLRDRVVLEVAAAGRRGCAELDLVRQEGDDLASLRHVRSCQRCEQRARAELDLPHDGLDAVGPTGDP